MCGPGRDPRPAGRRRSVGGRRPGSPSEYRRLRDDLGPRGREAPEAARRTCPQVAIIDVNLPDGSGLDLVPLLRAEQQDLPVVLSTGHVELNFSNQKNRILSLMKPYELEDLLAAIGSVVAATPAMQLLSS
ncbi:MAG TPA: response regulator [Thermoanaerobaculia bacterium]